MLFISPSRKHFDYQGQDHHTFDTSMFMAHGAGSIIPENCFADENIGVLMVNNEGQCSPSQS